MNYLVYAAGAFLLAATLSAGIELQAVRVLLVIFAVTLALLHHFVRGRSRAYRTTEFLLLMVTVLILGTSYALPNDYKNLWILFLLALVIHGVSALVFYWKSLSGTVGERAQGEIKKTLPWVLLGCAALLIGLHFMFPPKPAPPAQKSQPTRAESRLDSLNRLNP
ncbi:hypothetical protein [Fibrivirga algicola]|uniref:Uncharacterized protein n=1 Tax=Fibrivirga algicola TaxID=2950420 RepID=A0ABX0QBD4_9BACT|nr:hypothetical protein [Fibrivirga algicola]NID09361.1 hypothetical protein [Fibrivirga algicola]